jgi:hypothetical protein
MLPGLAGVPALSGVVQADSVGNLTSLNPEGKGGPCCLHQGATGVPILSGVVQTQLNREGGSMLSPRGTQNTCNDLGADVIRGNT